MARRRRARSKILPAGALAVLLLGGCSPAAEQAEDPEPTATIEPTIEPTADPYSGTAEGLDEHARAACREWSDTIDADLDVDGLREASARITALAAPSDNDVVVDAAVTLQAGLTEDDAEQFEVGTRALTDACWPAGRDV